MTKELVQAIQNLLTIIDKRIKKLTGVELHCGSVNDIPNPKDIYPGFQYHVTDYHENITWDGEAWYGYDGVEMVEMAFEIEVPEEPNPSNGGEEGDE